MADKNLIQKSTSSKKTTSNSTNKTTQSAKVKEANKPTNKATNAKANNKPTAKETKTKDKAKKDPPKWVTNLMTKIKSKKLYVATMATLFVFILTLSIFVGVFIAERRTANKVYAYSQSANTLVGYSAEYLGTVKRKIPTETKNEGLERYPKFGYTLSNLTSEQKQQIIDESVRLTTNSTFVDVSGRRPFQTYDYMDENGFLYLNNGDPVMKENSEEQWQLYKHTGGVGNYLGDVADDEPGVVKRLTLRNRGQQKSYNITGLYAPAGEVVKLQISEEDMNATGGLVVHIGQALYNGQSNNIWASKNINRMPNILNTLVINKTTATLNNGVYTAYIGSFVGGPIYIRNVSATYTVTISGAVNYSHFILGYTTREEFEYVSKSTAPYFDLEVWHYGVLHSGPKHYAKSYSYDDLYKAANLWEKISLVTTSRSSQGVVFLYDCFVAAGAAVAFPGRSSVNCPMDWMGGSLNYNSFVNSGAWGNMHEYHHNFQGFGLGGGDGEVTNNSLNLVSYSLFTKVSSHRQLASYGAAGLSGWNAYTSATWTLNRVKAGGGNITGTNGLAIYATLLHNLGQDAFMKSSHGWANTYFTNWSNNTHLDMSYFASLVTAFGGGFNPSVLHEAQKDRPMFVPVSCVYQTGRSYYYDNAKRYITTQQPFEITYGKDYIVDLSPYKTNSAGQYESGSIEIPNGFTYKIKKIDTSNLNGKLSKMTYDETNQNYVYKFKPNRNLNSGKIIITLEITNLSNKAPGTEDIFPVQDVDLVLEFKQNHEMNKNILERTTYTYSSDNMYTSATQAYDKKYAGYSSKKETDNINPIQNSNTDIWYRPLGHEQTEFVIPNNTVVEIKGKLRIEADGKYRIALRGRRNCALYLSLDNGETYELKAWIQDETTPNQSWLFRDDPNTLVDLNLKAGEWVYYKTVLIVQSSAASYIGLGIRQWTVPTYTMRTEDEHGNPYLDEHGNPIVKYFNSAGQEVSEEEANNVEPIAPANMQNSYATAFRSTYEVTNQNFESDYFYTRRANYSFSNTTNFTSKQSLVSTNYQPWTKNVEEGQHDISKLFDGRTDTYIHTVQDKQVSATNPFDVTAKFDEQISANNLIIYGYKKTDTLPSQFKLYGSKDGAHYFEMKVKSTNISGLNLNIILSDIYDFSYYRLVVTGVVRGQYFATSKISFSVTLSLPNGTMISPDSSQVTFKGKWNTVSTSSNYGHIYVGSKRTESVEVNFTGTRIAILSSTKYGDNYEVYIDGKKLDSVIIRDIKGDMAVRYVSPNLKSGNHKVKIVCKGNASIDSFVLW